MKVLLQGHDYQYEVLELLKIFITSSNIDFIKEKALADDQSFLLINRLYAHREQLYVHSLIKRYDKVLFEDNRMITVFSHEKKEYIKEIKRNIKLSIYEAVSNVFEQCPEWGILTGIRPTKITHELMDHKYTLEEMKKILNQKYKISNEKANLLLEISEIERPFIKNNTRDLFSLYISIPFCPTRCVYCSFPSNPLTNADNAIEEYMNALIFEISAVAELLKEHGKQIETLYIGGGTPTALDAKSLDKLLAHIDKHIDLLSLKEITVEAGRPDTINKEKLKILKTHGVNRISINPQSMNDKTLEKIGRKHSSEDIIEAYWLAKKIGFSSINMDIIVGLPDEGCKEIETTMKELEKLSPENITVHTLAIKRASKLKENLQNYQLILEKQAKEMLELTKLYTHKMGMIPYYLYRQKFMVGNLENTGYCKPNYPCIYNIQIMEERQSILALGAGAISKFVYPKENRLERVPNITNLEQYISRVEEMVERKRKELQKQSAIY
ncbi:MAG: coproporphyrinogen dehydrogenase HemZ [Thermotaleaceae bacterium]